jgi:hypothetical protein
VRRSAEKGAWAWLIAALVLSSCKSNSDPAVAAPASRAEGAAWQVELSQSGDLVAGSAGAVQVSIGARPGFHVNPDYPVKFTPSDESTVTFASKAIALGEALKREPCEGHPDEACRASGLVSFTTGNAPSAVVAGTLAFSVCSAEQCLIEKQPLRVSVPVR